MKESKNKLEEKVNRIESKTGKKLDKDIIKQWKRDIEGHGADKY